MLSKILFIYSIVLVRIPVLFEFTASLLVDLLFYVEFALVKDGDVVGKDSDFNLWPLWSIKR